MLFIQFKEGDAKKFTEVGPVDLKVRGSCQIPDIKTSTNYTIQIRYARKYQNRYYYGKFGTAMITSTQGAAPDCKYTHDRYSYFTTVCRKHKHVLNRILNRIIVYVIL